MHNSALGPRDRDLSDCMNVTFDDSHNSKFMIVILVQDSDLYLNVDSMDV